MITQTVKPKRKKRLGPREMKRQVALLRDRLFHTVLKNAEADDILPSENELADQFGFSLAVIRNLYRQMQEEGLAYGQQGKGIFLTDRFAASNQSDEVQHLKIAIVCYIQETHPMAHTSAASRILSRFESMGSQKQCQSKLYNLWPELDLSLAMLQELKDDNVDGILFHTNQICPNEAILAKLSLLDIPLVVVGAGNVAGKNSVSFDHTQIAVSATEHLISKGRKKLAFIQFEGDGYWQLERIAGFSDCAEQNGLESIRFEVPMNREFDAVTLHIKEHILPVIKKQKVTGVLCSGDLFGAALINALRKERIAVPDDLAIVGVDDDWSFRHYDLTTVQLDQSKLGEAAFELMTQIIHSLPEEAIVSKVSCPLIVRSTT